MRKRKILLGILIVLACVFVLSASSAFAQNMCVGDFDYDTDCDGTDAALFKSDFGRGGYTNPCPPDGPAPVARTGAFLSYHQYDDPAWLKGVYPLPPRFSVDGSWVTDRLTGLEWLRLPVSNKTWEEALETCVNLPVDDSRLPNLREMMSLFSYQWYQPALCDTGGYDKHSEGNPFYLTSVQYCWTSTTYAPDSQHAWYVNIDTGKFSNQAKAIPMYAWCVKEGRYPTPRFTVNGDGTVTDHKLHLVWLQDVACPHLNPNLPYGRTWYEAVATVDSLAPPNCGLTDGSVSGDWRLPTLDEVRDFLCYRGLGGDDYNKVCNTIGIYGWNSDGDPFNGYDTACPSNNCNDYFFWTSTEPEGDTSSAYIGNITTATPEGIFAIDKSEDIYFLAWPVRQVKK